MPIQERTAMVLDAGQNWNDNGGQRQGILDSELVTGNVENSHEICCSCAAKEQIQRFGCDFRLPWRVGGNLAKPVGTRRG